MRGDGKGREELIRDERSLAGGLGRYIGTGGPRC